MTLNRLSTIRNSRGAAALAITIGVLAATAVIGLFTAKSGLLEQQRYTNNYRTKQAFEAAEAGLEYGIAYLLNNKATIVVDANNDGKIDNYSDSNTTNAKLTNGSTYSVNFTNPITNNLEILKVSSIGANDDNTAMRKVEQVIKFQPIMTGLPSPVPVTVKGQPDLGGSLTIINTTTDKTIWGGSTATFEGAAKTMTSTGVSSNKKDVGPDVTTDSNLAAMTNEALFSSFFTATYDQIKSKSIQTSNGGDLNYSAWLDGKQNVSIWIEKPGETVQINDDITLGSPDNPVVLIVNGNLKINGNATIYGFVYVTGDINTANGTGEIVGAIATANDFIGNGNFNIVYSPSVLNNLHNQLGQYAKVSGSWNDLQN